MKMEEEDAEQTNEDGRASVGEGGDGMDGGCECRMGEEKRREEKRNVFIFGPQQQPHSTTASSASNAPTTSSCAASTTMPLLPWGGRDTLLPKSTCFSSSQSPTGSKEDGEKAFRRKSGPCSSMSKFSIDFLINRKPDTRFNTGYRDEMGSTPSSSSVDERKIGDHLPRPRLVISKPEEGIDHNELTRRRSVPSFVFPRFLQEVAGKVESDYQQLRRTRRKLSSDATMSGSDLPSRMALEVFRDGEESQSPCASMDQERLSAKSVGSDIDFVEWRPGETKVERIIDSSSMDTRDFIIQLENAKPLRVIGIVSYPHVFDVDTQLEHAILLGFSVEGKRINQFRYRDVRRILLDRMEDDHREYVTNRAEHALILRRLPKKLTLREFAYRILVMTFHSVITSGVEPAYWKILDKRRLLSCLPEFSGNLTMKVARNVFDLRVNGKCVITDAIQLSIEKCKSDRFHRVDEWSLEFD